ncbi:hypothetical protein ADUPG1_011434 [Aduncisulcus paluster]|uniref:AB hydrolase-1 domain-containing protein n=1 Tax=Aduncisulcus paluster TaxID=2918883 RepID=A0ABQ5JVM5_9EUKA|nr:hypothetical protein ADUPG1_011434 [Aduncisulcus paluster]
MEFIIKIPYNSSYLSGILHYPKTGIVGKEVKSLETLFSDSDELVIFVHGLGAHKNSRNFMPSLAASITKISLRFDFPGCGESPGEFSLSYYAESDVLLHVIKYFQELPWNVKKFSLVGHSKGTNITLLTIARLAIMACSPLPDNISSVIGDHKKDVIPCSILPSFPLHLHSACFICGRYDMTVTPEDRYSPAQRADLTRQGWFLHSFRKDSVVRVTREMLIEKEILRVGNMARIVRHLTDEKEIQFKRSGFILESCAVLHHAHDDVIPFEDGVKLSKDLGVVCNRIEGKSRIPHCFVGLFEKVADILELCITKRI